MLQGDGGADVRELIQHTDRLCRGDVFHAEFESGVFGSQVAVHGKEFMFAVHDKAVAFAMHQQGDAEFLHEMEGFICLRHIGHAALAVGGDAGGIELEAEEAGCLFGGQQFRFSQRGEEKGHVTRECGAIQCCGNAFIIRLHGRRCGNRRYQIGHNDSSCKIGRSWCRLEL